MVDVDLVALGLSNEEKAQLSLLASYERAKRSFDRFVPYVKISESGEGMVPLLEWDHIKTLNRVLSESKRIVLAKSRQIGITTDLSAFGLWHAMFTPRALVLYFSKGERDAWEFLAKSRNTYRNLPEALQEPLGEGTEFPNNREQMSFANGGRILTLPSTESAGRGLNPTLVVMDEADFHEYLPSAYHSVKPGLDDNDGYLILTSTVNPHKARSLFQDLYKLAPVNGFTKLFFGWKARPERDDAWYKKTKAEYLDQALFQKEHSETEAEAFAPAAGIAAFNLTRLTALQGQVKPPVMQIPVGVTTANIYQDFIALPNQKYMAGTDPSHGVGGNGDDGVTVIMHMNTGAVVADIRTNTVPPDQLAIASMELLERYKNPIWAIEDNEWGILAIRTAQAMRYRHLYHRDDGNKVGWHTDERSRNVLWGDLREAIETGQITIFNEDGLAQFFEVIYRERREGRVRIEARSGGHDDYPTAVGIAWQMRMHARSASRSIPSAAPGGEDTWGSIIQTTSGRRW